MSRILSALLICLSFFAPVFAADTYRIVHTYPHDSHAFTQGLVFVDGRLYESTGINGQSSLRMVDLETGRVLQEQPVDEQILRRGSHRLGQHTGATHLGIACWAGLRPLQLPPAAHVFATPAKAGDSPRTGSLSSSATARPVLRFFDPATFAEVRRVTVKDRGKPVTDLNELEFIQGEVYANVWHTDRIARISPRTGKVLSWIDLKGLLPESERSSPEAVLNGIAWDPAGHRLFVTGKLWPKLFEIDVVPRSSKSAPARRRP